MKTSVGERIVKRLQGFAEALEKKEKIAQRFTCRKMQLVLKPKTYNADDVKKVRKLLGASQAIFAMFLGVSVKTVRSWEQGLSSPSEIANRFMDEIRLNPEYWLGRLRQMARPKHATS